MLSVSKWLVILCDCFDFLFDSISSCHRYFYSKVFFWHFFCFIIFFVFFSIILVLSPFFFFVMRFFWFYLSRCLSPLLFILPKFMYKNVTELNHNKNNNNSKLSRESHDRRLAVGCGDCWCRPLMVNYLDRQWTLFLSPINLV